MTAVTVAEPRGPAADRKPPLAALIAIAAASPMSLNIFVPSMPGIQRALGTDYGTVQLTLTLYLVAFAVAQLVHGPLSDRFGRRRILLVGQGIYLAGSLACLLAGSIGALIAGRVVQAAGVCAGLVVVRAMVRDVYDRERAAVILAYVHSTMAVAPMVAPAIGGFLDVEFGWRSSFVLLLASGVVVMLVALVWLGETHTRRGGSVSPAALALGFVHLMRLRRFCGYGFQVSFTSAVFFAFIGGAPFVMVDLMGRPASDYGLYFVVIPGAFMAGGLASSRLIARVGSSAVVMAGLTLSLAASAGLAAVTVLGKLDAVLLFGAMAVAATGNGLSQPSGFAGAISADPHRAGAASGLVGFLQMAIGAAATYVVGSLLRDSALPVAVAMLMLSLLAVVSFVAGVGLRWRPGDGASESS